MDLSKIEELIALMRQSGVMHLSVELPEYKVSITRGAEPDTGAASAPPAANVPAPSWPLAESRETEDAAGPVSVTSPVVGVFRNGGAASGRQVIAAGQSVKRGQLLAAIEAMKVPNELRSPVDGVVTAVLVEDGSPVEYGQALFSIRPAEGGEADETEAAIGVA